MGEKEGLEFIITSVEQRDERKKEKKFEKQFLNLVGFNRFLIKHRG